jgi:DNA-directed RNA polymerase subunit alpha
MSNDPLDMVIGTDQSAQRNPEASSRHFSEALKMLDSGDRFGAVAELRRAVAADPENNDALFQLAYQVDLMGEEDEAIALYERCCDRPPAPVRALMNLAVLFEDRGDHVRAERCLRQVLDTNPTHPRAKLFMKDVIASKEMVIEEDQDRDILKRRALLDTPVTDFELSVRARTCLKKMNIRTLGDLLRITEQELMSYKNFGESSLEEIKKMLSMKGLRLGQGLEDAHRSARRAIMERLKGSGKEALLNKPVGDLQLSVRARKALQVLNIQTLGDLCSHTEAELMGVKNFGATSLTEVREKLTGLGLSLRIIDEPGEGFEAVSMSSAVIDAIDADQA